MIKRTINHSSRILKASEYGRVVEALADLEDLGYINPQLIINSLGGGDVWVSSSVHIEAQRYPLISFEMTDDVADFIEKKLKELKDDKS